MLTELDEKTLYNNILKRTSAELLSWLPRALAGLGYPTSSLRIGADYIIAEGTASAFVIDIYAPSITENTVQTLISNRGLLWSPEGIASESRCALFAILEIVKRTPLGEKPTLVILNKSKVGRDIAANVLTQLKCQLVLRLACKKHDEIEFAPGYGIPNHSSQLVLDLASRLKCRLPLIQSNSTPSNKLLAFPTAYIPFGATIGAGGEYIVRYKLSEAIDVLSAWLRDQIPSPQLT